MNCAVLVISMTMLPAPEFLCSPPLVGLPVVQARNAPPVRAAGIGYPPPNRPSGQARLLARRAAEVVAVRNLKTKLGKPRCAAVRFRYVSTHYRQDGSVEVVVEAAH